MEIRHELREQLRRLKTPGMWQALDTRLAEARESELDHLEFLSLLIQDELANCENNMLAKRIRNSVFGLKRTFAQRDFHCNPTAARSWERLRPPNRPPNHQIKHDSTIRPSMISVTAFPQATRYQDLPLYCGRNSPRAALGNPAAPR